jgi:hypothetical protein
VTATVRAAVSAAPDLAGTAREGTAPAECRETRPNGARDIIMPADDPFVRYMRARQSITASIHRGRRASLEELRQGHDFAGGSLTLDAQIWSAEELDQTPSGDAVAIDLLQKIVQRGAAVALLQKLESHYSRIHDVDGVLRCIVYLACQRDGLARTRLAANLGVNARAILTPEALHRHAAAVGLLQGPQPSMRDYLKAGFTLVEQAGATSEKMLPALLESTEKPGLDDSYHDAQEQTAGDELLAKLQGMQQAPGVVVVPPFETGSVSVPEVEPSMFVDESRTPSPSVSSA